MGKKDIPRILRNVLTKRFRGEHFIVLDIGTYNVKGLYVAGGEVVAFANKQYTNGSMNKDGGINERGIATTCRFVLKELRESTTRIGRFTNKVVLGMGGGFVYGKTLTQTYIRDYPNEELTEGEFGNIVQKVQQRNYEQIRRDFKQDTGRSELDVYLIGGALQDIKIDGYQVVNPIGFKGKEVSCGLFNCYIPKGHLDVFEGIISSINLQLVTLVSEPYAVFRSFYAKNDSATDFILIDMGGSTTEISLARKGRLDDIRSIAVGGASFTRSISENLKIGLFEAENIKRRFTEEKVSKNAAKKIEGIIMDDVKLFLRGLEMVLLELSQTTLLPSNIYIYGGGSMMPVVAHALRQRKWRDSLSFSAKPIISNLTPSRIDYLEGTPQDNVLWTVPFSIANIHIEENKNNDELIKMVKRSLRLIQGNI